MIELRKQEILREQSKKIDWDDVEDKMVTQWYGVSKVMHLILPQSFPYFTFEGIVEEIRKDPNYKTEDGN